MTPVTPITIALALVAMVAVCFLRPGRALGLIIALMLIWPEYLRIPIGLAQMSAPRMAALALIVRMALTKDTPRLRLGWIDALPVLGWVWDLGANFAEGAGSTQIVYMVGRFFDTVCMYYVARLSIRSARDIADLYPMLAVTAAAMGVLGAWEAITASSYYERLYAYGGQAWFDKQAEFRYGFLRARASTAHAIYFGMAMIVVTGMIYAMRGVARRTWLWLGAVLLGVLGAISSLSSGPQLGLAILCITSVFYFMKPMIKPAIVGLVLLCVLVEMASNRHFYQLIDYLALNSETAWYRGRLLEVAVSHLPDYWLFGVGDKWPHHWGLEIDTRLHVDVVNHFILVALNGGVPSLLCFVGTIIGAMRAASRIPARSCSPALKQMGFGLVCVTIGLAGASMSVGLFGPPLLLTYMLLGLMVSLPGLAEHPRLVRPAPGVRTEPRASAARPSEVLPA